MLVYSLPRFYYAKKFPPILISSLMKMSYLYNLDYGTFIAIIIALAFLLYFSAYVHHHHDNIATKKMISSPIK